MRRIIPHAFGFAKKVPIIDNEELLKQKIEMLDALSDMQLAVKLLNESQAGGDVISTHYKKLRTDLVCTVC